MEDDLKRTLSSMIVPEQRWRVLSEYNLMWLTRNLHIDNAEDPRFVAVMIDIRDRLRNKQFESGPEIVTLMENYF